MAEEADRKQEQAAEGAEAQAAVAEEKPAKEKTPEPNAEKGDKAEKAGQDEKAEKPADEKAAPKKKKDAAAEAGDAAGDGADGGEKGGESAPAPARKQKGGRHVTSGIVHVTATFNNTLVSITDTKGNVISWSSAGRCGFKGSRKSTAFAATTVAQEAARAAVSQGLREVEVRVQGPGAGRESAVRAIQSAGINIMSIKDVTPIPHNGCRPPKRRRV